MCCFMLGRVKWQYDHSVGTLPLSLDSQNTQQALLRLLFRQLLLLLNQE